MHIIRKCLKKEVLKRLQKCKNMYIIKINEYTYKIYMFLNENVCNEHTLHKKRD